MMREESIPALKAIARTLMTALETVPAMLIGPVQEIPRAGVGSLPSTVYLIDAPTVGVLSVSEKGRLKNPLCTLAFGSPTTPLNDTGPLFAAPGDALVK